MASSGHAELLTSVVRRWAPHLRIVSVSHPEPHLERFNIVATTSDPAAARAAVLELEAEEIDDARVGLVVLGPPTAEGETVGVDPEGVSRALAPRIAIGGAVGAAAGAGIGAAATALGGLATSYIVGAALAGAALGAVPGAIWATFGRMGASDAYRQTFVDEAVDELNVVALHTTDEAEAERALARLRSHPELSVHVLDPHGSSLPSDDRR